MAVSATPVFVQSLRITTAICTDADTAPEAVGTTARIPLFTAGTDGSLVTHIGALPRATIADSVAHLYHQAGGTGDLVLIAAQELPADTVSDTDAPAAVDFGFTEDRPLKLEPGDVLHASISVAAADGITFWAQGGNL